VFKQAERVTVAHVSCVTQDLLVIMRLSTRFMCDTGFIGDNETRTKGTEMSQGAKVMGVTVYLMQSRERRCRGTRCSWTVGSAKKQEGKEEWKPGG
jgi:hypothetical protein